MPDIQAVRFSAYGGPEVLKLDRIAAPRPGPGEVLIEVHAVSMNPIDWKIRSGRMQKFLPLDLPVLTGRDGAGFVRSTGPNVDASLLDTRVCFMAPRGVGTWAEQIVLPASLAVPVPENVSFTDAAALPLAGVSAWIGLVQTGHVGAGMRTLIHAGAGGVGSLAVQIARHRGGHVIASCSDRNVEFVRALGAHEVIAYDRMPFETRVRDVDLVFDLLGGDVHARSYQVLRRGGAMVCLSAEPYQDRGAEFGVEVKMARILPDRDALASVVRLAADGILRPVIEHRLAFSDFAKAHELSERGHARGKIVLQLR